MDRIPVLFADILTAVKTKLVSDRIFTDAKLVVLTLTDRPDQLTAKAPADRFASVMPGKFDSDLGLAAGGGRTALTFTGPLKVSLWARIPGDTFGSDEESLLDPAKGHLLLFAGLMSSLEQFDPVDGSGKGLLSEPMRCKPWWIKPRKAAEAFCQIVAEYQVIYQQLLPTVPLP
jgi:hypothetical protein